MASMGLASTYYYSRRTRDAGYHGPGLFWKDGQHNADT